MATSTDPQPLPLWVRQIADPAIAQAIVDGLLVVPKPGHVWVLMLIVEPSRDFRLGLSQRSWTEVKQMGNEAAIDAIRAQYEGGDRSFLLVAAVRGEEVYSGVLPWEAHRVQPPPKN